MTHVSVLTEGIKAILYLQSVTGIGKKTEREARLEWLKMTPMEKNITMDVYFQMHEKLSARASNHGTRIKKEIKER